ncbi:prolyl-tRNA synthetase [Patescibacteria group bacterium]|nr:prolyl-tRNA synthetase [Patescibacteria group bacterium]
MKQSKLFYKTFKEVPKDVEAVSHSLLVRAGFVDQVSAGIFNFLPLGFKVLKKIENIIREEMEKIEGQEILMSALIPKENLVKTGRWDNFDVLFKLKGANKKEYALGATHEEIISPMAKKIILSYKDLPLYLFQIQNKFRDELRAKSGLLRTREFMMKDLYSFHTNEEDLEKYYLKVSKAYENIFKRCGIKVYKTLANGGSFSKYSHEYQTPTEAGEDIIYVCKKCNLGINKEIKSHKCPECGGIAFEEKKAVEVGNIFQLKDAFSLPFDLKFKDSNGKEKPVLMGCYGIGLGRLMATIVEVNNDENGIIWPESVSPYNIHLIQIGETKKEADKLYIKLLKEGKEVLYDDREVGAGEKFADADLIGISERWVISPKTLEKKSIEIKKRNSQKTKLVKLLSS